MLVTLAGIVTLAKLAQRKKASFPMLLTPLAMVALARPPQS